MDKELNLLKILLQEKKYPYFSDEELEILLINNDSNVYLTAAKLSLMKADSDKETKIGPITIKGPGADYWINLSNEYSNKASSGDISAGGYKRRMNRVDDI